MKRSSRTPISSVVLQATMLVDHVETDIATLHIELRTLACLLGDQAAQVALNQAAQKLGQLSSQLRKALPLIDSLKGDANV